MQSAASLAARCVQGPRSWPRSGGTGPCSTISPTPRAPPARCRELQRKAVGKRPEATSWCGRTKGNPRLPAAVKSVARAVLPAAVIRRARAAWEDVGDWRDTAAFGTWFLLHRSPMPSRLIFFGFAAGDDLLCTAVLRELRLRGADRLLMVSSHPDLFLGNPDPAYVRPIWRRYAPYHSTVAVCRRFARIAGAAFIQPEYAPPIGEDRRRIPSRHVIAEMCAHAGITGKVSLRPYINLSDAEKSAAAWAREAIVVQSSGMAAASPMRNKQWYPERFQNVIDAMKGEAEFIQLGSGDDPVLRRATDLRGRTSIRQSAAILHHARLYVGTVGFLMHLARAVECPSVIVFGGREAPAQSGYICNANLYSPVACAPCWRGNTCELDRQCMQEITEANVVDAIRRMLVRPRGPLETESVDVASG